MTTCLKTFEKERFCNFPHRHGEATGKPETRDETPGRSKTSISCEASSKFDTLTRYQTSWNVTKCHACHANLLGNLRKGEVVQLPSWTRRSHRKTRDSRRDTWGRDFRQNSQLKTFEKDSFCSFPHRHGEATGKPETRDETRGGIKTSISCETSSNFDTL